MEFFLVEYEGEKIPVQKNGNGSIVVLLPARFGDRGSQYRESIIHEERGWRFTSTQDDDIEYYFHMWLKPDGRMAWADDMTYGIKEFDEPFNPYYPNAGLLNDTALKLYSIVKQIETYQKRDIPANELLLLRQYYLNTGLKALGYDSIDDVIADRNNSCSCLGLNKVACMLENYKDLSDLVFSIGEISGEDTVVCIAPEEVDRKKALEFGVPVKEQIQDNIQFIQEESTNLGNKRRILPGYRTKMEESVGIYTFDNYKRAVKDAALLLLELNADLLTDQQKEALGILKYKKTDEMTLEDRISKLIDSKDFEAACKTENEFAYEQSQKLIKRAKEIQKTIGTETPVMNLTTLTQILVDETRMADGRKKALDNNERYNSKNKRKSKGYSLDDE